MYTSAGFNFINIFTHSCYARSSPERKNSVKLSVSFYAFGIYARKSCTQNVDEIESWLFNPILKTSARLTQACQTGSPIEGLLPPLTQFFFHQKPKTYLHFIESFSKSTRNWYKKLYLAIRIDLLQFLQSETPLKASTLH